MKINNPDNRMINNVVGWLLSSRPKMPRSRVEVCGEVG